ncbi:acetoacetate decarboxylase family protein [Phormidium sp. CCY1219]|uniref:acetoacetate decarboxylase family protein n=1 Tax=Phormidium sp. CCY1219 TaxID=2886104 RepID=UPI002D1EC16E|nr:acetoacetate decarboxylase family protein [Phormidium sp. CCY1219]MEB3830573.1 acetoacetate decarboxylase family protein [Phormidium sp. CCY1219]
MTYPPPPWNLSGHAVQTLHLIDTHRVRSRVPATLDIVEIWPGKTVGGVYLAEYGGDSILQYNELIVLGAIVRYGIEVGSWISHIYVDNPDSVEGGRGIWGLPKEMAEFTWEKGTRDRVRVSQGDRHLCSLDYNPNTFRLPLPFSIPNFSLLESELLLFPGKFKSNLGLVDATLQVPPESPFSELKLEQPGFSLSCEDLHLLAGQPKVVGEVVRERIFSHQ